MAASSKHMEKGYTQTGLPGKDELLFLPLGGCQEIGMNLNLYGHDGKWLMVDLGVTFGDDRAPGVDVITPDPTFIEERRQDLLGIVVTHAHEDHLGGIPWLWSCLQVPVYATPFAAAFLRRKLRDEGLAGTIPIHTMSLDSRFELGPFDIEYVTLAHSIPEPNGLMIRTKAGNVFHTGDWKIDPTPDVNGVFDQSRLAALGDEGVLALVCDSTNAMVPGHSESEADVAKGLKKVIAGLTGQVAVTCFASNVARLRAIAHAAMDAGRQPALVGRSLWRMHDAARETGYFDGLPPFLDDRKLSETPADQALIICTGSQGEPRAALARIARDDHPSVRLGHGDTVLFSSRDIPGNEKAIGHLHNNLSRLGVEVISGHEAPIHASGHPCRDELLQMYGWIRPQILIPVHGEQRQLKAQVDLAKSNQIPHQIILDNGEVVSLTAKGVHRIDEVFSGRLAVSGEELIALDDPSIRERRQLAEGGAALITLVLDGQGLDYPQITLVGLPELDSDEERILTRLIFNAYSEGPHGNSPQYSTRKSRGRQKSKGGHRGKGTHKKGFDEAISPSERIRRAVRRHFATHQGKKPLVVVHETFV